MEKLGAVFNQVAFPLQYTPRKFVIHPESNNLIIIETDHNAYTEATKAQRKQQMAEVITLTSRGAVLKMKLLEKLKFKTFIIIFLPAPPAYPSTRKLLGDRVSDHNSGSLGTLGGDSAPRVLRLFVHHHT